MEYISIIAIVVGVLFSLFEKSGKQKKKTPTPTPAKKTFSSSFSEEKRKTTLKEISTPVSELETIKSQGKMELDKLIKEKKRLEKKLQLLEQQTQQDEKALPLSYEKSAGVFTKNNAVDAIIFSEVLSPPRSKRSAKGYRRNSVR